MNKTLNYILIGILCSVGMFALMTLLRMLIRGVSFNEAASDWTNIIIAVACGASIAISTWKKNQEKEEKAKKEEEENK